MTSRPESAVIARLPRVHLASGDVMAVDLVAAEDELDEALVRMAMCFVQDAAGDFLVVWAPRRREWSSPGGWREPGETVRQGAAREVFEESGLVVDPARLQPVGWERFTSLVGLPRAQHLQLYAVRLTEVRPSVQAEELVADSEGCVPPPRWLDFVAFRELCGEHFWWPVAEHLFGVGSPRP